MAVGVPVWSPDGSSIAFVSSKGLTGFDFGIWLVNPDGSNLRNLANAGLGLRLVARRHAGCTTSTPAASALKKVAGVGRDRRSR